MGKGLYTDTNHIPAATLTGAGGDWAALAPLDNIKTLPLHAAAVTTRLGTRDNPIVIDGVFSTSVPCRYVGMFGTNLRQRANCRVELFSNTSLTTWLYDSRDPDSGKDLFVIPPMLSWRQLYWGAPNLFRGDLPPADYALYPSNFHLIVPFCRPKGFRISLYGPAFDTDGSAASTYRIGYAWIGDGVRFFAPLDFEPGYVSGDTLTRVAGGGVSIETGTGYRTVTIQRPASDASEATSLFDSAVRLGLKKPCAYVPTDNWPAFNHRFGGLFQRRGDYAMRFLAADLVNSTVSLEEIRE